jgi:hypothetical protein
MKKNFDRPRGEIELDSQDWSSESWGEILSPAIRPICRCEVPRADPPMRVLLSRAFTDESSVGEKIMQATLALENENVVRSQPRTASYAVDRWVTEQMFEEDVRAVLRMVRPHGRERRMGWREYRTGGSDFRVTVSWDEDFETARPQPLMVPRMADVIESLLIGSARNQDDLTPREEFALYREVVEELRRRIDEMEGCYG